MPTIVNPALTFGQKDVTSDRSPQVIGVASAFMPIALVCVILRCYVRLRLVKAFGWDDGMMVVAMLWYIMFSACEIGGAVHGTGKHFAVLTPQQRVSAMEYWWLCEIAYCLASVAAKVSVCLFLLRITIQRRDNWILYTVMFLTVLCGLIFLFLMLLQCKPLSYFWTRTDFENPNIKGECLSIQIIIAMTYVYSTFAAICDFTVGILPMFLVRKMKMRRHAKIALVGILSMACIASCAVIIRMPYVQTFADPDFLFATVPIALWSNVELGLGISAGSLATLRPLLRKLRGGSSREYESNGHGRSGSRLPGLTRDRGVPLASMDQANYAGAGEDKARTTVTTIQSPKAGTWMEDSSPNSSEEHLASAEHSSSHLSHDGAGGGLSIYRTVEVTATSMAAREHV